MFVHLHVLSHHSRGLSICRPGDLAAAAARFGMPALALTDRCSLSGALEFQEACLEAGLRPIFGLELRIPSVLREKGAAREPFFTLVVLAEDQEGYSNLVRLVTEADRVSKGGSPFTGLERLRGSSGGLIALSGGEESEVSLLAAAGESSAAEEAALGLRELFGAGRFFVELQDHGLEGQGELNRKLALISEASGIPLVATNTTLHVAGGDALACRVARTLSSGGGLDLSAGPPEAEHRLKSPEEMAESFRGCPEALENASRIAGRCRARIEKRAVRVPCRPPGGEESAADRLRRLGREGLEARMGPASGDPLARERLEYELSVIERLGFAELFLLFEDLHGFCRENRIMTGPGRGAVGGSLAAYALGLTKIDPLRHGLIFERLIDPGVERLPDLSVDVCAAARGRVVGHWREVFGADRVAGTSGAFSWKPRILLLRLAEVLGIKAPAAGALARKCDPYDSLLKSLSEAPDLAAEFLGDERLLAVLKVEAGFRGVLLKRVTEKSGVVLGDRPLTGLVPLYFREELPVAAMDRGDLSRLGFLVVDLPGFSDLTELGRGLERLCESAGRRIELEDLPLDDGGTWRRIGAGEVQGLPHIGSRGFQDMLREARPACLADLAALISLDRPAPMNEGLTAEYVARMRGKPALSAWPDPVRDLLSETRGLLIYQETCMHVANRAAGFSMTRANSLRKAVSKKKVEELRSFRREFVEGAVGRGLSAVEALDLFGAIEESAPFGFCKAHAVSCALTAYWAAFLKGR